MFWSRVIIDIYDKSFGEGLVRIGNINWGFSFLRGNIVGVNKGVMKLFWDIVRVNINVVEY